MQDSIAVLAEFMRAEMSRIRNKSAYLSGVIGRFREDRYGFPYNFSGGSK